MRRKARKIRVKLEASQDLFEPVIWKLKGMHQKTFGRLRRAEERANQAALLSMAVDMGYLSGEVAESREMGD